MGRSAAHWQAGCFSLHALSSCCLAEIKVPGWLMPTAGAEEVLLFQVKLCKGNKRGSIKNIEAHDLSASAFA
jgi:hypothetical protein